MITFVLPKERRGSSCPKKKKAKLVIPDLFRIYNINQILINKQKLMKKFLLSLAAVVLTGTFSMAETVTVNFADETTADLLPSTESATAETAKINGVDFEFINCKKGSYSKAVYLQLSGKNKTPKGSVAFTLPDNCTQFTITTGSNASVNVTVSLLAGTKAIQEDVKLDTKGADFAFEIPADYQAAGTKYTLQVTNKYNAQISKIVFVTEQGGSTLADAGLAFANAAVTVDLSQAVPANALTKVTDAAVVYSSSNEEVATVDAATGEVKLVASGTTTIKAVTEATDKYKAGEASYTLTVTDNANIVYENDGKTEASNFTFEAGEGENPWEFSDYGMTGNAFKLTDKTADAYAVSPVFDLTERIKPISITQTFAYRYLTVEQIPEYFTIVVREEGATEWTVLTAAPAPETMMSKWTYVDDYTIDLGAYEGKKIQVGYHYVADGTVCGGWQIKDILVKGKKSSAVSDIIAEDADAPVVYYNLQGVRVANPSNGLYIRVQGKKATKVLVR